VGAAALALVVLAGCSSDPPKPETPACQQWTAAINSTGGASIAKLKMIADSSAGEVHSTMEAYITLAQVSAGSPDSKNAFQAVKEQCLRLGISA